MTVRFWRGLVVGAACVALAGAGVAGSVAAEGPDPGYRPKFPATQKVPVPKLTVIGPVPGGQAALRARWTDYYPRIVKYIGLPYSFADTGITWVWDTSVATGGDIGWDAAINSVRSGPAPHIMEPMRGTQKHWKVYEQFEHETGHLFLNPMPETIHFDFGQWIWEAHALAGQSFVYMEKYGQLFTPDITGYDTSTQLGDRLYGVLTDGDKVNRTPANSAAASALVMLTEVVTPKKLDFIKQVNEGLLDMYHQTGNVTVTADRYRELLNNVGGSGRIDGMRAGDWLFAQPVSNIAGKPGPYITALGGIEREAIVGAVVDRQAITSADGGHVDLRETPGKGVTVTVTVTDAKGKRRGATTVKTDSAGEFRVPLSRLGVPPTTPAAYRIEATAEFAGQKVRSSTVFMPKDALGAAWNPYVWVIPVNADGSIRSSTAGVKVTGGTVTKRYPGLLKVKVSHGSAVTVSQGQTARVVSKPFDQRVVPVSL